MPEFDAIRAALTDTRAGTVFDIVLVTDSAGALLAADWSEAVSPETFSALLALAQRVTSRPDGLDALTASGESHFFDWDGRQVVCRPFAAMDGSWLVVALAPPRGAYKQALGRLIKQLQTEIAPALPKPGKIAKAAKPRTKRTSPKI